MTEEWCQVSTRSFPFTITQTCQIATNSDRPGSLLAGAVPVCPEQDGCLL